MVFLMAEITWLCSHERVFQPAWCLAHLCQQTRECGWYFSVVLNFPVAESDRKGNLTSAYQRPPGCLPFPFCLLFLRMQSHYQITLSHLSWKFFPWVACDKGWRYQEHFNLCCEGRRWCGAHPLRTLRASEISLYPSQCHMPPQNLSCKGQVPQVQSTQLADQPRASFSSHGSRLFCFPFSQIAENTPIFLCF